MTYINVVIFFFIALIYSSAGFGGGSLYLAVLSQSGFAPAVLRWTALLCNAVVTGTGVWNYHKNSWAEWRRILPLLVFSLPMTVLGASFELQDRVYFILLACALLLAAIAMVVQAFGQKPNEYSAEKNPWWIYPIASAVGLLAGMTGIGGGIYLAPILHIVKWDEPKKIAAASSAFILVNSIAGLCTQAFRGEAFLNLDLVLLIGAVLVGGAIGSRLSIAWLSQKSIRWITIGLLIFAAVRILSKYL